MDKLEASVLSTVFRNPENGYSVVQVLSGREHHTVVGVLPELSSGEQAVFSGEWTEHRTYGRQFHCASCEIKAPTTLLGIERFLSSGLIRGIKNHTAAQIIAHFGEDSLTVLSEHPERLMEIPGIGPKRCAMITESFQERQSLRKALIFLQRYGIPASLATKIAEKYQDRTEEVVLSNPYILCDEIEGIGFKTADRIGLSMGIAPDSPHRVRSVLLYMLQEAASASGHVYLPEQELLSRAVAMLNVPSALCQEQLTALLLDRRLAAYADDDGRRIYLPLYDLAEKEVAMRLRELMLSVLPNPFPNASHQISGFERKHRISFSPTQRRAIRLALENGVFVITGGPGTGKTTIIKCILDLLSQENQTVLCAPTGRAAKRMTEATGVESKTIHRLLQYSGSEGIFSVNEEDPLDADCVIADEASMIDLLLMRSLLRAIQPGSRLILVGDADQLPSVGAGNVLSDILLSGQVPHIRLTDIFRQSETSRIVLNAHLINRGEMPQLNGKGTDFFFERRNTLQDTASSIVALATSRLPAYLKYPPKKSAALSIQNIQVLSPTRKGECGVDALNLLLQQALNPAVPARPEITWNNTVFRLGDKVIQTKNDYNLPWIRMVKGHPAEDGLGVFNGDIGYVTHVDQGDLSLTVCFDDDRVAEYKSGNLECLDLAYCLSVHKSQGSEFPVVVMPVIGGPRLLLTRNLLYTALTRAKSLVVLVGREEVIRQMVENNFILRRYTALAQRLVETEALIT